MGILCLGQTLHWQKLNSVKENNFPESPAVLIGTIDSFPVKVQAGFGQYKIRFRIKSEKQEDSNKNWRLMHQRILVTVPSSFRSLKYGDKVILKGEFLKSTSAQNPGGFDFESYLFRKGISKRFFVKDENDFMILAEQQGNPFIHQVNQLKRFLITMIDNQIPSPENGVIKAMLLGDREELRFDIQDYFSKSGTAHILAISGLHVGLIASIFIAFLRLFSLSKRWSYLITIFLLVSYSILSGGSASVLRSTIMITHYLFGFILKRESEWITSLSWSAIFILIFEPFQLFDPGFQLSFLTVFSLGIIMPKPKTLETDFLNSPKNLPAWHRSKKVLSYLYSYLKFSFAAWIGTLPLIAHYFFLISPVTILANFFVIPYLWIVLSSGFAFLVLGSFNEFLGEILGLSLWFFTKILILMSQWFSSIPLSHFRVAPFRFFEFAIFYGFIALWILRNYFRITQKRFLILSLIFLNFFIWKGLFLSPPKKLKITFLDVGHGDSALIEFPEKGRLLVDTGGGGEYDQGKISLAPFLWSRGITRLDGILITHPHLDHYGGLKYILNEFSVGTLFDNGDRSSPLYEENFRNNRNKKMHRVALKEGDEILGAADSKIIILHPPNHFMKNLSMGPNDQSILTSLRYKKIHVLMSGDAEEVALEKVNRYGERLRSHLLKVPHHGSNEKNSGNFFSFVKPEIAIISESKKNRFNLPSKKTVELLHQLGAKIYQTGLTGAVEFETDGTTYSVKTMLENRN